MHRPLQARALRLPGGSRSSVTPSRSFRKFFLYIEQYIYHLPLQRAVPFVSAFPLQCTYLICLHQTMKKTQGAHGWPRIESHSCNVLVVTDCARSRILSSTSGDESDASGPQRMSRQLMSRLVYGKGRDVTTHAMGSRVSRGHKAMKTNDDDDDARMTSL
jgi:hypothetical protein